MSSFLPFRYVVVSTSIIYNNNAVKQSELLHTFNKQYVSLITYEQNYYPCYLVILSEGSLSKNGIIVLKRSARQQSFSGNNERFCYRNTEATAPLVTSNEYRISVVNGNSMCPFILLSESLAESFKRMTLVSTVVLLVGLANKAGNRVHCSLVMFMTSRD